MNEIPGKYVYKIFESNKILSNTEFVKSIERDIEIKSSETCKEIIIQKKDKSIPCFPVKYRYSDERFTFDEVFKYLQSQKQSESKGNKNSKRSRNKELIFPLKYRSEFDCLTKDENK